jgi:hypothetical protein
VEEVEADPVMAPVADGEEAARDAIGDVPTAGVDVTEAPRALDSKRPP